MYRRCVRFHIDFKKYGINVSQILRASQAVPDQDLEIRGGGGCGGGPVIQILKKGGARSRKKHFSALRASFWWKNKGGPGQGSISGQA